jgi:hypothetical protein
VLQYPRYSYDRGGAILERTPSSRVRISGDLALAYHAQTGSLIAHGAARAVARTAARHRQQAPVEVLRFPAASLTPGLLAEITRCLHFEGYVRILAGQIAARAEQAA